ncbi:hypothetical protein AWC38_SpisGene3147 [Stylophora pistillata]|uniref:TFIIB-type domain-containing protein n=1 Tax=Stylophora pistillata TaxID=50429 RepID=A0A2B4SSF7_STYPI|nr:hypothetical protein AWC38_SpisGene3147 [Stylophora pistillata]
MPSKCPVCLAEAVDAEEGGELVCTECGAVVESRVYNFDVDRQNGYTTMAADGTAKFDGRFDLPSMVRQRLPTSDTSKYKKRLQKLLYELAKRMNLSNETVKEAKDFLLTTVASRMKSGEIRHYFSLAGERNHFASAMALVLIVLDGKKITPRKEKIADVLSKNSVTNNQVKSQMKNSRRGLVELAKDVPWIPKSLKPTAIARHIDDIVEFHKNCGRMDLSAVKSLYMKRKECAENDRKRKIQMAKARIDKEKTQQLCSSSENSSSIGNTLADSSCPSSSSTNQSNCGVVLGEPMPNNLHVDGLDSSQQSNPSDDPEFYSDNGLDDNDALIEHLLRNGYSEEELMEGYFESRMVDLQGSCDDPEGEREDLDELDIRDSDMHHYLWSVAEVERRRSLKKDDSCQAAE